MCKRKKEGRDTSRLALACSPCHFKEDHRRQKKHNLSPSLRESVGGQAKIAIMLDMANMASKISAAQACNFLSLTGDWSVTLESRDKACSDYQARMYLDSRVLAKHM